MQGSNNPLDHGWGPESYAYQEGVLGQIPAFISIANFKLWGGGGVPSASLGADGDYYFRSDGAAGANTCIYHRESGAWVGLTA